MGYQSIYNQLRANGLTEAGALAMLGNWECESNCVSCRLQGDFKYPYNTSKEYANGVDTGRISRDQFKNDRQGFGLAQWTLDSRKACMYDFAKTRSASIGDENLQIQFAISELVGDFPTLLNTLRSSNDLYECTNKICYQYENPAIKNVDARFRAAVKIRSEIDLNPQPVPPEPPGPEPDPPGPEPDPPAHVYWPPRTIDCHCVDWPEVTVLGSALYCRGYLNYAAGAWDDEVTEAVKAFQRDNRLTPDGCVGPMTWGKLLERG